MEKNIQLYKLDNNNEQNITSNMMIHEDMCHLLLDSGSIPQIMENINMIRLHRQNTRHRILRCTFNIEKALILAPDDIDIFRTMKEAFLDLERGK